MSNKPLIYGHVQMNGASVAFVEIDGAAWYAARDVEEALELDIIAIDQAVSSENKRRQVVHRPGVSSTQLYINADGVRQALHRHPEEERMLQALGFADAVEARAIIEGRAPHEETVIEFGYRGDRVRFLRLRGELHVVAVDLARAFGYAKLQKLAPHLSGRPRRTLPLEDRLGRRYPTTVWPVADIETLIERARQEDQAKVRYFLWAEVQPRLWIVPEIVPETEPASEEEERDAAPSGMEILASIARARPVDRPEGGGVLEDVDVLADDEPEDDGPLYDADDDADGDAPEDEFVVDGAHALDEVEMAAAAALRARAAPCPEDAARDALEAAWRALLNVVGPEQDWTGDLGARDRPEARGVDKAIAFVWLAKQAREFSDWLPPLEGDATEDVIEAYAASFDALVFCALQARLELLPEASKTLGT